MGQFHLVFGHSNNLLMLKIAQLTTKEVNFLSRELTQFMVKIRPGVIGALHACTICKIDFTNCKYDLNYMKLMKNRI